VRIREKIVEPCDYDSFGLADEVVVFTTFTQFIYLIWRLSMKKKHSFFRFIAILIMLFLPIISFSEEIKLLKNVKEISSQNSSSCALDNSGVIKCWGSVAEWDSTFNSSIGSTPIFVLSLEGNIIRFLESNTHCVVMSDEHIKCWGESNYKIYSLLTGNDISDNHLNPITMPPMKMFIGSKNDGCFITESNTIKCWGSNTVGQLGNGTTDSSVTPVDVIEVDNALSIVSGLSNYCASLVTGGVKCWGYNSQGWLGTGDIQRTSSTPKHVKNLENDKVVSLVYYNDDYGHGFEYSEGFCALTSLGSVKCWNDSSGAQTITSLGNNVSSIVDGGAHICVLTKDSKVKCWGGNLYGQLGEQTNLSVSYTEPTEVVELQNPIIAISAGREHTCALSINGTVKCWGRNGVSQLGNMDTSFFSSGINSSIPVDVVDTKSQPQTYSFNIVQTGDGSGNLTGSTSADQYAVGDIIEIIATPELGSIAVLSDNCSESFEMPAEDIVCTVTFEPSSYYFNIVPTGTGSGKLTGSTPQGQYAFGKPIDIVAIPDPGSTVSYSSNCSASFEMPAEDVVCTVTFTEISPPEISLLTQNSETPVTEAIVACDEIVDIELSHTAGSWIAFINGINTGTLQDGQLSSSIPVSSCSDIWNIELRNHDLSITSNTISISWSKYKLIPTTYRPLKEEERLLTTKWSQYKIPFDYDNDGDTETFVPGCTAVAIGQLTNYYFQQGYKENWLDVVLDGVTVYPRLEQRDGTFKMFEFQLPALPIICDANHQCYPDTITDESQVNVINSPEQKLWMFLTYLGIGLDAAFSRSYETSVGRYIGQEPYPWLNAKNGAPYLSDEKTYRLMVERFRFNKDNAALSDLISSLDVQRDYIVSSLDSGHPILVTLRGYSNGVFSNPYFGHSAVIDAYRIVDGKFQVKINMGWGDSIASDTWYDTSGSITLPINGDPVIESFDLFMNTRPINWGEKEDISASIFR